MLKKEEKARGKRRKDESRLYTARENEETSWKIEPFQRIGLSSLKAGVAERIECGENAQEKHISSLALSLCDVFSRRRASPASIETAARPRKKRILEKSLVHRGGSRAMKRSRKLPAGKSVVARAIFLPPRLLSPRSPRCNVGCGGGCTGGGRGRTRAAREVAFISKLSFKISAVSLAAGGRR